MSRAGRSASRHCRSSWCRCPGSGRNRRGVERRGHAAHDRRSVPPGVMGVHQPHAMADFMDQRDEAEPALLEAVGIPPPCRRYSAPRSRRACSLRHRPVNRAAADPPISQRRVGIVDSIMKNSASLGFGDDIECHVRNVGVELERQASPCCLSKASHAEVTCMCSVKGPPHPHEKYTSNARRRCKSPSRSSSGCHCSAGRRGGACAAIGMVRVIGAVRTPRRIGEIELFQ